jgi:HD-GYP domain-containing protein (c-di-GMP phosphodiesterase class II)
VKENKPAIVASIMLVIFFSMSIWLVMQYVEKEKERDMNNWQDRLTVLAESQKRAVEAWLNGQIDNMKEVAENPLLQIYLTLGGQKESEMSEAQRGQVGHLKNLLVSAANRAGVFHSQEAKRAVGVGVLHEGMAVVDNEANVLLSTVDFPDVDSEIKVAVSKAMRDGKITIHGIYNIGNNEPRLIIVVPVKTIQAASNTGAVIEIINPELTLYQVLAQHWLTTQTDETLLVKGGESDTVYISPLSIDPAVFHEVALSNTELAANFGRENLGGFALKKDYKGTEVLVTANQVHNTDWILVQKINASEALRESREHQEFVLTTFLLAVFVVTISFIAIWRHSTSIRLQKARDVLAAQTELLIAVSDNIRDPIFLLDNKNHFVFVNRALSTCAKSSIEELKGLLINHVFDVDATEKLLDLRGKEDMVNQVMELTLMDCSATAHATVVSLKSGKYKNCDLYVLHDITSLKEAQDKHNRLLEGIISTLVRTADMHDPHCANHSERTREVATAIAQAMELPEERCNTLAMAALLANIGKLYLPREVLTKMEKLTSEEEEMFRDAANGSVDILKDIEFDGPVIKFIEQRNEHLDGSGYPAGISGDEILQESRILSVSNAFVAMTSARAYRVGKPIEEVLDILLEQVDGRYDRHVVAALFHVAENRSDWVDWQEVKD